MAAEDYIEAMKALKEAEENGDIKQAFAGTNKAAATRVRKAFLTAKKAFHESRQEIQAIKKGEEKARENVPSFFDAAE
jgi:ERCC4-type nuclease